MRRHVTATPWNQRVSCTANSSFERYVWQVSKRSGYGISGWWMFVYWDVTKSGREKCASGGGRRMCRKAPLKGGARAARPAPRHQCIFRTPFNARLASTDGNNALIPVIKSVLEFGLFTCFYFSSMIILNSPLWPIRSREYGIVDNNQNGDSLFS